MYKIYFFFYRLCKKRPWVFTIFLLLMFFFALGALGAYPHLEKEEILYYRTIFILLLLFVWEIQIIGPAVEKTKPKEDFWNYITCFDENGENLWRAMRNAGCIYLTMRGYYITIPTTCLFILYLLCSSFF